MFFLTFIALFQSALISNLQYLYLGLETLKHFLSTHFEIWLQVSGVLKRGCKCPLEPLNQIVKLEGLGWKQLNSHLIKDLRKVDVRRLSNHYKRVCTFLLFILDLIVVLFISSCFFCFVINQLFFEKVF